MKSKQKTLIALGLFVATSLIFLAGVVYPIFQGVLHDHKIIIDQKKQLLTMRENSNRSHEFETISQEHEKEIAQLKVLLVDSETPVSFFRFLDQQAAQFSLHIEKTPGSLQKQTEDVWSSFDVRILGEGAYSHFIGFLQKLESAPYLMEVQTLTLTKARQSEQTTTAEQEVEFSLSVKVFVQ